MKSRVLVVDDEKSMLLVIEAMLKREGIDVRTTQDGQEALKWIADAAAEFQVVVTDLSMPGVTGMQILEACQRDRPWMPVVMMTAFGTVENAVSALKKGAFDFVTKPFDRDEILNVIQKAIETARQREKEPVPLWADASAPTVEKGKVATPLGFAISSIVGSSAEMQEVFRLLSKVAPSPSTVLILGESGTGKELVAYEIHRNSPRARKPFVKINCAAIPATLIESELFGYERGAFTGAVTSKPGRFELAHEGTLFLDEVADMPLEMQVKLLRVLQEQELERVGGVASIQVDVRIIAATNKDLEKEVREGRFREDLFYRLNVFPIVLPPLRCRKADIDALLRIFISQFNEKLGKKIEGIEPGCLTALRMFQWPGNIRQLENFVERMVLLCDGNVLRVDDLPLELKALAGTPEGTAPGDAFSFKEIVKTKTAELEKQLIETALNEASGNVTKTAEALGLSRKGLQLKMKDLGIERGENR